MKRNVMFDWVMKHDTDSMLPVFVISHERAGRGKAPLLDRAQDLWKDPSVVNVVVRESQYVDYALEYPDLTIHALPDAELDGVGFARWRAVLLARELGYERIIMADDDVLKVEFKFQSEIGSGVNAGAECSKSSGKPERVAVPHFEQHLLAAIGSLGSSVLDKHPSAMLGGVIKQHMSFSPNNHREQYVINGRATPRQIMVWDIKRMIENGVELNLERFGKTGDDIGIVAEILKAGFDCFTMPSFTLDHWAEDQNVNRSIIRNAETKRDVLQYDFESMQLYPMRDYMRVKRNRLDNSFEWADVNWTTFHKIRGTKMSPVLWDEDAICSELYGNLI